MQLLCTSYDVNHMALKLLWFMPLDGRPRLQHTCGQQCGSLVTSSYSRSLSLLPDPVCTRSTPVVSSACNREVATRLFYRLFLTPVVCIAFLVRIRLTFPILVALPGSVSLGSRAASETSRPSWRPSPRCSTGRSWHLQSSRWRTGAGRDGRVRWPWQKRNMLGWGWGR